MSMSNMVIEKKAVNTMVEISGIRNSFVLCEDAGVAGQFIDLGQADRRLRLNGLLLNVNRVFN